MFSKNSSVTWSSALGALETVSDEMRRGLFHSRYNVVIARPGTCTIVNSGCGFLCHSMAGKGVTLLESSESRATSVVTRVLAVCWCLSAWENRKAGWLATEPCS